MELERIAIEGVEGNYSGSLGTGDNGTQFGYGHLESKLQMVDSNGNIAPNIDVSMGAHAIKLDQGHGINEGGVDGSILGVEQSFNLAYDGEGYSGWGTQYEGKIHGYSIELDTDCFCIGGKYVKFRFLVDFLRADAAGGIEFGRENQWGANASYGAYILAGETGVSTDAFGQDEYIGGEGYLGGFGKGGGAIVEFDLAAQNPKKFFESLKPTQAKWKSIDVFGGGGVYDVLGVNEVPCE